MMVIAFAVGLHRALEPGRGARWAPRLIGVYGASLIAAGIFRADPALGFPVGAPEQPTAISWHGMLHFASGGIGFTCLAIACFILGSRYSAEGRRGWAAFCRLTGAVFLVGFAMVASSGGNRAANLAFVAAIILVWTWMTCVAVDRYRSVSR
jgi:O-antigen ligase